MLSIGSIAVDRGLLLAPMEDVTDHPFRLICKEMGADLVYTEFINAEGLARRAPLTVHKLKFQEAERPIGIQIYGASELSMEEATKIASSMEPDLIDINCGCWVSKVALRGAGAGLLRDLPRMREVVKRVIDSTDLPVTVKTRLGWDAKSIRIVEVARMLEEIGVRGLTVHCRTRAQGHRGAVDYAWIGRIKEAVSMPLVLNGDITVPEDVASAFSETGCDGVMIGRGAIRHPWIFRDAKNFLTTGGRLPAPSLRERTELCMRHLQLALEHQGDRWGVVNMRRFYAGYFRGLPGAARLRGELARIDERNELIDRINSIADQTQADDASEAWSDAPVDDKTVEIAPA